MSMALNKEKRKKESTADVGTVRWLLQRAAARLRERRTDRTFGLEGLWYYLTLQPYRLRLWFESRLANPSYSTAKGPLRGKNLYASAIHVGGKLYLKRILEKFGYDKFDYMLFVWDGTKFDEDVFKSCQFVYERGIKWSFMKKYLTPEVCDRYDYIFAWDDDIDIRNLSIENFLDVVRRNKLEVAQPALTADSYANLAITFQQPGVGRLTDYTESMVQVFQREAWKRFWCVLDGDRNPWGWGTGDILRSVCKIRRMGIVDCEPVVHTKPGRENLRARADKEVFLSKHASAKTAKLVSYGRLK